MRRPFVLYVLCSEGGGRLRAIDIERGAMQTEWAGFSQPTISHHQPAVAPDRRRPRQRGQPEPIKRAHKARQWRSLALIYLLSLHKSQQRQLQRRSRGIKFPSLY